MPAKIHVNDDLLLRMLTLNDQQAINVLYQKHHGHLSKIINRIVRDKEATKDILQDLFIVLWERRHSLNITKPIKAYLIKSAVHRSLNFVRDRTRHPMLHLHEQEMLAYLKSDLSSEASIELEELRYLIKTATSNLPSKEKIAFILKRKYHMTYQEIAVHLGISKKTVEKRITKAQKYLRSKLKPYLKSLLLLMII